MSLLWGILVRKSLRKHRFLKRISSVKDTPSACCGVIHLLKRISYGFRNRQNYIAKMMTAFLPLTTIQILLIHHPV